MAFYMHENDKLLSPKIIRTLAFRIIKVFENAVQMELVRVRREEIKRLQPNLASV